MPSTFCRATPCYGHGGSYWALLCRKPPYLRDWRDRRRVFVPTSSTYLLGHGAFFEVGISCWQKGMPGMPSFFCMPSSTPTATCSFMSKSPLPPLPSLARHAPMMPHGEGEQVAPSWRRPDCNGRSLGPLLHGVVRRPHLQLLGGGLHFGPPAFEVSSPAAYAPGFSPFLAIPLLFRAQP